VGVTYFKQEAGRNYCPKGHLGPTYRISTLSPLWVTSDRTGVHAQCPLLLQERTFRCVALSDALGHERTHALQHDRRKMKDRLAAVCPNSDFDLLNYAER
jgi:hypothetical protein